jgi:hypothetical protein
MMIYEAMPGEAMRRQLDYDRRRYWLANWLEHSLSAEVAVATEDPFTLRDVDLTRLLGLNNAHGLPRAQAYDPRHRFRRTRRRGNGVPVGRRPNRVLG